MSRCGAARWAVGRAAGALLSLALVGCTAGTFPRPAVIPRPGRATFTLHQVIAGIVPGTMTVTGAGGVGGASERRIGNAAVPQGLQGSMVAWGPIVGIEGRLAFGIFDPCEGAALVGISRVGTELRCAVARGPGNPAIALAGAFGYEPFFSRDGWWARLSADIATPPAPWQLLLGPAVTLGPEAYALPSAAAEDFSLPGDAEGAYAQLRQTEVRLSLAIGVAYSGPTPQPLVEVDGIGFRRYQGTTWILGIVPFISLSSTDSMLECVGCSTGAVARFDAGWGASLVAGVGWFDPSEMASPFAPERLRME